MKQNRNFTYIFLLLFLLSESRLFAQTEHFIVSRTSFSSRIADEFSPVFYKDGLVFCSNRGESSIIGYSENQKGLFKILYVKKANSVWKQPGLLSIELTSPFNDGPVTFNSMGNFAWFSRNNRIENTFGNVNDTSNKLGIFSAEFSGDKWTNIKPFSFADPGFNYTTPSLSPDGKRLYFSSDKPGGFGGMDLYYCAIKDGQWKEPVNLGPLINTPGSEAFPFASMDGKLFFSSDGHKGYGGKDIFFTRQIDEAWISPVLLDSAINSIADDFGLVSDSAFKQGYFSSNRMKTDDIFSFKLFQPEFAHCDTIKENNFCFTFYDERQQQIDSAHVIYQWDFGDGMIRKGKEIKYCFPGAGEYIVKLTILDAIEGKLIADKVEYKVNLEEIEQALINSDNIGLVNHSMSFHGMTANLPGFTIKECFWDFGDGFRPGGLNESMIFGNAGEYPVQLGIWGEKDSLGIIPQKCFRKNIHIFNSFEEMDLPLMKDGSVPLRVLLMDGLSENQKLVIKEIFQNAKNLKLSLSTNQVFEADSPITKEITRILLADRTLRVETRTAAKLSQELSFYFRNNAVNINSFYCQPGNLTETALKSGKTENKSGEKTVEFIFMKSNPPLNE